MLPNSTDEIGGIEVGLKLEEPCVTSIDKSKKNPKTFDVSTSLGIYHPDKTI